MHCCKWTLKNPHSDERSRGCGLLSDVAVVVTPGKACSQFLKREVMGRALSSGSSIKQADLSRDRSEANDDEAD